jgi:hypothetical protein
MSDPNFPDPKDYDKKQDENFNQTAEGKEAPVPEAGFPSQPVEEQQAADKDESSEVLEKILLNEVDPGMRQVKVALGWDGPEKTESFRAAHSEQCKSSIFRFMTGFVVDFRIKGSQKNGGISEDVCAIL